VGAVMELCQDKRGVFKNMEYIEDTVWMIHYEMPLNEIIYDFFDALKSRTRGYASLDYEMTSATSKQRACEAGYTAERRDGATRCPSSCTRTRHTPAGRSIVEKLKEVIPRQLFEIPIQAAIGGKIIARETVKAMRKDVLAKCYGGDISRKKKLLEKQKEGKKRMRQVGTVEVPAGGVYGGSEALMVYPHSVLQKQVPVLRFLLRAVGRRRRI
jgi:GTP-binding protein LepA